MPVAAVDTSWTLDPGPILLVGVLLALYVRRWRRVRAREGPRAAGGWRLASWVAGCLVILAALVSPVDALGEQVFVMHMAQHLLLIDVAPILLILGLTKVLMRPVTRRLQPLERRAGILTHPATAVVAYVVVMWVWHVPALYDAALEHASVHVLEHTFFFSAGFLYWYVLLSPVRTRLDRRGMHPVVYMLSTKVAVGLLGIALTFAPDALYDFYERRPEVWGLSPSEDQALAGALMALEQSLIMGVALAWLFVRALAESEKEQQRAERLEDLEEQRRAAAAGAP
ncbi:MAG TPA: cytochrome c oxidase assembly protein [Solirubrobacteraceae bacterium]|nr:cytochrome c oxidase assembly protein [Solirubrobacteraceae bacterium]